MTLRSTVDTQTLLTLARSRGDYFTDLGGDPFAELSEGAGGHVLGLRSESFRVWLDRVCYEQTGALPAPETRREVLSLLEGMARFEAPPRPVHVRLAEHEGAVHLDLGGPGRHVVRVDAAGWRIEERSTVAFFRPRSQKPIPRPEPGGSLHALTDLFPQLSLPASRLVVGWMVGALRPAGPYPILILQGERGSGKSSLARAIKLLLDASKAPLRAMPKGERDLLIGSMHAWVGVYDNLGPLSAATSDAFCRISTGGGLGTRKLFTDQDESVLDLCRPVILTGIEELATRPDLCERAVVIRLPHLPGRARRDEASLARHFDSAAPGLLGVLLDGVSAALAGWPREEGAPLPRMADFARWVSAAEPALGWEKGTFLDTYARHRSEADLDALEHDAVAPLVLRLPGLAASGRWRGTATEMWLALTSLAERAGPRPTGWPKSPSKLTGHLRNVAPLLRAHGVEVASERTSSSRVLVVMHRRAPRSSPANRMKTGGYDDSVRQ
jgi:hypothetical protein